MKTKEELDALKKDIETLNKKLAELTDEELKQVIGGVTGEIHIYKNTIENDFTPI